MATATWFIPKQKLSDKAGVIFDGIRDMFKDLLNLSIDFGYFKEDLSIQEQVSGIKNAFMFAPLYASIYLEKTDGFVPLFKIKSTANNGLVVVPKEANTTNLSQLVGQKVVIPNHINLTFINPIILYLVRNCQVLSVPEYFLSFTKSAFDIENLLQNEVAAILTNTFDYEMMTVSEQKRLKVIGQYPLESDYVALASPDFKIGKFKRDFENWLKQQDGVLLKNRFLYASIGENDNDLLIEAIEGLGYNIRDFINQYSDLMIKTIQNGQSEEIKILNEKYNGLQVFNEKLVNMYKEIRESRDRLYKEIDSSLDNQILFLKDGTILGISRGFLNWVHTSRQEVIGRNIADFISPNMNKSFRELIQQIDHGLIKSFGVHLAKENSDDNFAKMDFTILELQDSKIILGIIGKKANKSN